MRILSTLILPDAGRASVQGHDVTRESQTVRRICGLMLGDERSWYWRLSGRHNLEFFAVLHGFDPAAARVRAEELLARFGLVEAADRPFGGYSAGMKARLSLARALIADPPVLLLDEPTRSLDPVAAARFREVLTDLARERSGTVLIATHELHEAAQIGDQIVVLDRGRVALSHQGGVGAAELERELLAVVGS